MYTAQAEPIRHWSYYTIIHERTRVRDSHSILMIWMIYWGGRESLLKHLSMHGRCEISGSGSIFILFVGTAAPLQATKPAAARKQYILNDFQVGKTEKHSAHGTMRYKGQIKESLVQSDISILLQHQLENILSNKFFSCPSSSGPTLVTYSLTMKTLPNQQKDNDKDKYKDKDNENDKYI